MRLRMATTEDLTEVLVLYDEAVAWLVSRGITGQWGTEPFSAQPGWVDIIRRRLDSGRTWLAESDAVSGAITLKSGPPSYVEEVDEPEIYITGLITSRRPEARGLGKLLLDHARQTARAEAIGLLRLDCFAGGGGGLVDYYLAAGFTRVRRIKVDFDSGRYQGQLMQQRI